MDTLNSTQKLNVLFDVCIECTYSSTADLSQGDLLSSHAREMGDELKAIVEHIIRHHHYHILDSMFLERNTIKKLGIHICNSKLYEERRIYDKMGTRKKITPILKGQT